MGSAFKYHHYNNSQGVPLHKILVAFPADEKFRKAVVDVLADFGTISFLSEIPKNQRSTEISHADVLISWHPGHELKPSELAMISNVKLLQLLSAGVDHLSLPEIPASVTVAGNVGAYAEQMSEHAVAMILAIYKNLLDRHNKLTKGVFDQVTPNRVLEGSICAIVGFGGIGKACARRLRCMGVKIFAINTSGKTGEPVDFVGNLKDLEQAFRRADIIIISIPLTKATRGLIGKRELGWLKSDATIVNLARGHIIDEAALFEKLKTHPNLHAAIDAWWSEPRGKGKFRTSYPFLKLPNVLGSPHNSGVIPGAMPIAATYAAQNVKRFLNNQQITGVVNRSDYN
jgi:phosphoglycerate dehydrogenase-like enzyme